MFKYIKNLEKVSLMPQMELACLLDEKLLLQPSMLQTFNHLYQMGISMYDEERRKLCFKQAMRLLNDLDLIKQCIFALQGLEVYYLDLEGRSHTYYEGINVDKMKVIAIKLRYDDYRIAIHQAYILIKDILNRLQIAYHEACNQEIKDILMLVIRHEYATINELKEEIDEKALEEASFQKDLMIEDADLFSSNYFDIENPLFIN